MVHDKINKLPWKSLNTEYEEKYIYIYLCDQEYYFLESLCVTEAKPGDTNYKWRYIGSWQ